MNPAMIPHRRGQVGVENPHGAEVRADGTVRFRLWAPAMKRVGLELAGEAGVVPMAPQAGGWHEWTTKNAAGGTRYRFVLPDGMRVPDPASRYQPEDVHGPSEVVNPAAWSWNDAGWSNRPWDEAVIYELHIGAFTSEGTFRAAIEKLDHLCRLGVTALEIMPIAEFPGRKNWGYDCVMPYAPDASYGRPEDFKALVEAAHTRGLMILLDVVYNHFGPEGNYLPLYAPSFFTSRHKTPWGAGLNFDGPESRPVRDFIVQNAIYWTRQFHIDGLRLDAVHAILDDSPRHILEELAESVYAASGKRPVHLILENEENQARWLERERPGQPRLYTAQWNDDAHHVLHTAATGEDKGYYQDYRGETVMLGRALAQGFAFQGELMTYRGTPRGEACAQLPPSAFIAFLQNHDQIGNRALGDRIRAESPAALRAAAAVYLLLPQVPMLFMGEEWGATSPFPFFCDFGPELAEAVRQGRREEFARFPEFQDPTQRESIPDPQAEETFASSKLIWDEISRPEHREWLDWYQRILARRRESIVPLSGRIRCGGAFDVLGNEAIVVRWALDDGRKLVLAANLSAAPVRELPSPEGELIWEESGPAGAWSVRWWIT
jgi:malto-oligosyltrehalose trehalohydrolase